jgi:hypothetical protein
MPGLVNGTGKQVWGVAKYSPTFTFYVYWHQRSSHLPGGLFREALELFNTPENFSICSDRGQLKSRQFDARFAIEEILNICKSPVR